MTDLSCNIVEECGGSGFLDSGISLGLTGSIRGETWV